MKIKKKYLSALVALSVALTSTSGLASGGQQSKLFKDLTLAAKAGVLKDVENALNAGCDVGLQIFKRLELLVSTENADKSDVLTYENDQGQFFSFFSEGAQYGPTDKKLDTALAQAIKAFIDMQFTSGTGAKQIKDLSATNMAVAPYPSRVIGTKTTRTIALLDSSQPSNTPMTLTKGHFTDTKDSTALTGIRCYPIPDDVTVSQNTTVTATMGGPAATYICRPGAKSHTGSASAFTSSPSSNKWIAGSVKTFIETTGEKKYDQKKFCPLNRTESSDSNALNSNSDSVTGQQCKNPDNANHSLMVMSYEVGMTISNDPVEILDGTLWIAEIKFLPKKVVGGRPTFSTEGSFSVFKLNGYTHQASDNAVNFASTTIDGSEHSDSINPTNDNTVEYDTDVLEKISSCANIAQKIEGSTSSSSSSGSSSSSSSSGSSGTSGT